MTQNLNAMPTLDFGDWLQHFQLLPNNSEWQPKLAGCLHSSTENLWEADQADRAWTVLRTVSGWSVIPGLPPPETPNIIGYLETLQPFNPNKPVRTTPLPEAGASHWNQNGIPQT